MDNNKPFAKTSDKDVAETLENAGFPFLYMEDDKWVFLNQMGSESFSFDGSEDGKKVYYTNTLNV